MFLISAAVATLLMPASDETSQAQLQAKIDAAKEAYHSCIFAQAAQLYRGRDDKRLEQRIGESCTAQFDGWLDAMSIDSFPEARSAAKDAMTPILREAIHLAVLAEVEYRRTGRRPAPAAAPVPASAT
ncbi:hypothetical protein [Phenylobacterium montanum]|uniref:Uncharacterized protein n=1 Tax=Phenylobacterium montanum TaxID=2823693 RepID=A0A975FYF1_9CAUL|nr:hypothetical protein [Caulobacter sp. S6]QUD87471.1 hypothetical protein KCG34_20830 [Caulobacter sp. S6]